MKKIITISVVSVTLIAALVLPVYATPANITNVTVEIIVPELAHKYHHVGIFNNGLATVWRDGEPAPRGFPFVSGVWGFIDKTGKEVIPAIYDRVSDFKDGLAAVSINGKWGFIDTTGKIVTPIKYIYSEILSEELIAVHDNTIWGKNGLNIDRARNVPMHFGYLSLVHPFYDTFCEERMAVSRDNNLQWGYINKNRESITVFEFDIAKDFNQGLASVRKGLGRAGYIDRAGNIIVPLQYGYANTFNERLAAVLGDNGNWFLLQITTYTRNIEVTFGATKYYLNNEAFTEETMVYNGVAYLPAAYLARRLGLTAEWNPQTNTTTLTSNRSDIQQTQPSTNYLQTNPATKTIRVTFGATKYYLNNEAFTEETMVYNGVAYLPAAYLARRLGLTAEWNPQTNITNLTTVGK